VTKKNKTERQRNLKPASAGPNIPEVKSRRLSASAKTKRAKGASSQKTQRRPLIGANSNLADEQIRMRAYFISERRRRFGLPGDANSDWLEAKRQLLSEIKL
jgi:Protein of unknown function (DUF2934)